MKSILDEKAVLFAVEIIKLSKQLYQSKDFVISAQILKSGTSIGANIREAQAAESKKDFVHKLSISQKEVKETIYWLELLTKTDLIKKNLYDRLNNDVHDILRIITKSIITTKKRYLDEKT